MREYHVRICERLGVKLPLSTRHETLYTIAGSEWSSFEDPGLILGGIAKGKRRTYFLVVSPSI
jgi:hypothetical protein